MNLAAITQQMIILFLLLLVGYAANRFGYMDADFNKKFSAFVINISTPAMILHSVMGQQQLLSRSEIFLLLGVSAATYAAVILLSMAFPKLLHAGAADGALMRFMLIFSNVGFMGFPVVASLLGDSAVFYASIFGMPFNVLVYSYGLKLVSGGKCGGFDRKTLLSPCIVSSVLAMAIYLLNIPIPNLLVLSLGYLSDITVPGAMLILGSSLALIPLKTVFGDARVYLLSAVKLVLIPVLLWAVMRLLPLSDIIVEITIIMWAMPVATNCTMLAAGYGGDEALASKGVLISTIASIVTIPLLMWALF